MMYCKKCHYDLRGLGDGGVCPECGVGFSVGDASYLVEKPMVGRRLMWWFGVSFWGMLVFSVLFPVFSVVFCGAVYSCD